MEASGPLVPHTIEIRACNKDDVQIAIKYAGICHSDIHQVREEWGPAIFPMVPGHEIAGIVTAVGENVTKFTVGQKVGVGCMVESCRSCPPCKEGSEQLCNNGMVGTYNSRMTHPHCPGYDKDPNKCAVNYGGYSQGITVNQDFVCSVPDNLAFEKVAPLLCAGITVYSPMARFGLKKEHKFAVAGLGGLGHMAVKIAKAWGCHVTVISRGDKKKEDALKTLGADAYLDVTDDEAVKNAAEAFNFMIDTISAKHSVSRYMSMVSCDGTLVMVGADTNACDVKPMELLFRRKSLVGSLIGGVRETQEMLDFCGKHNVTPEIELIDGTKVTEAYDRTIKSDVKYRFVIDTSTF